MKMKLPKSYSELTVSQYQQLEALKSSNLDAIDKAITRLSILLNKSFEAIELMTPSFITSKLLDCTFLLANYESEKVNKTFWLGFKKFRLIDNLTDLPTAQYKDFTEILQTNGGDYTKCLPELLAISHEELTVSGYRYIPENHFENVELFKSAKCGKVVGGVFFYSNYLKNYSTIIVDYLEKNQKMLKEFQAEMMADKEFQDFLTGGVGNTR